MRAIHLPSGIGSNISCTLPIRKPNLHKKRQCRALLPNKASALNTPLFVSCVNGGLFFEHPPFQNLLPFAFYLLPFLP